MKKPEKQPSLTLENFYGAFIVLITGYTLSLMVFGMETLQYYYYMVFYPNLFNWFMFF